MGRTRSKLVLATAVLFVLAASCATVSGSLAALSSPGPGAALRARNALGTSACKLLLRENSKVWVGGGRHPVVKSQPPKTCSLMSCWRHETRPGGGKDCAYARGAVLSLDIESTSGIAKNRVRRALRKGYRPLNDIHADLAGIVEHLSGTAIIFAVDRTVALVTYGASSSTDPHPHAVGSYGRALDAARHIASNLHEDGCPRLPRKC